jgi:hypothetical protein
VRYWNTKRQGFPPECKGFSFEQCLWIAESGVVHWKIKEITELSAGVYLMPDLLSWGKVLFSFRGDFLSHW